MQSIRTKKTRKLVDLPLFDRVALALLFLLLLSDILSGAVRYYSVQLGLVWLPYLPRLLLVLAVFPMFFVRLMGDGLTKTYMAVLVLFCVAGTYGVFNLGNANQVEFGLWAVLFFPFGIIVCRSVTLGWEKLAPYGLLLWALAVMGVLVNLFYTWPWAGFQYQVAGTTVTASHNWETAGIVIPRLAGFARGWFEAALQILFLALFLREVLPKRWWVPIWVLSGVAIALTTTKTTLAIFLLFSGLWIFSRGKVSPIWRMLPVVFVGVDILFPVFLFFVNKLPLPGAGSPTAHLLIASLMVRLQREYPNAINMILAHGNPILGRGLGGIGGAQTFFERAIANPGENIALYLWGVFGLPGLVLLVVYGWKASRVSADGPLGRFLFFCACAVLVEGATMSVLEASVFLPIAFGMSLWYVQNVTTNRRSRALRAVAGRGQATGLTGAGGSDPSCG